MTAARLRDRYNAVPTRPALLAIAGLSAVSGVLFLLTTAPFTWAADVHRNLLAADSLLVGTFGAVEGYLYSPLAAALTIPGLALSEGAAVLGWFGLKVAILLAGTAWATRGRSTVDRILAALAVIGFLPVVHDLALGNVTIVIAAAVAAVAWLPDRVVAGGALGLVLATAPKPGLIPVLVWMAIYRPRALGGALATAGLATLITAAFVGIAPFQAWITALRVPPDLVAGNFSLSGLPTPIAITASIVVIVMTVLAFRRGPVPGLLAAIGCGLLVSPYTILYAASVLLVVVPALARAAPRQTLVLALLAPTGLLVAFPVWIGLAMVLSLTVPSARWDRSFLPPTRLDPS